MFKNNFENEQKIVIEIFKEEISSTDTLTIADSSLFTCFPTIHSSPIGTNNCTETASSHY